MPIMEIKIVPLGTAKTSVSAYVAAAVRVLAAKKTVRFKATAMGTIVEAASTRQLLSLAQQMQRAVFAVGAKRVLMFIELDERRDKVMTMAGKLRSLQRKF